MKISYRHFLLLSFIVILGVSLSNNFGRSAVVSADPLVTIGDGTPASCQDNDAVNAIANAVLAGGVIDFNCGPDPVTIDVNTNITNQQVTINGGGLINFSGEDLRQIFYVMTNGSLTINDLVVIDGSAADGGAIYVEPNAAVTINNSFVSSSNASSDGGGIFNWGTLTINNSTIGSNIAAVNGGGIFNNGGTVTVNDSYLVSNQSQNGGAVYTVNGQLTLDQTAVRSGFISNQGGGIFAAGPTDITNSTFSNNRALEGGALFLIFNAEILNSTFNENKADQGGAIWKEASSNSTLKNSIVAGSLDSSGSNPSLNCDGPALVSLGRNIISDGTCLPNPGSSGDLFNTNPQLGVWLGSILHAYIPNASSPALDYGLNCPAVDQRGFPRPLGPACDVGSIERGGVVYIPVAVR